MFLENSYEIGTAYRRGTPVGVIRRRFGITNTQLYRAVGENGLQLRNAPPIPLEKIVARAWTDTVSELAAVYGRSESWISGVLRNAGLIVHPGRPRTRLGQRLPTVERVVQPTHRCPNPWHNHPVFDRHGTLTGRLCKCCAHWEPVPPDGAGPSLGGP
ncbi:hypothetical protein [Streptomyces sp. NPDC003077]|uniref:hypothetical protein n=1 Tax=Streptomyces sp. NPDC003077 TaxID=3154443 RepID=UPI0033B3FBFA